MIGSSRVVEAHNAVRSLAPCEKVYTTLTWQIQGFHPLSRQCHVIINDVLFSYNVFQRLGGTKTSPLMRKLSWTQPWGYRFSPSYLNAKGEECRFGVLTVWWGKVNRGYTNGCDNQVHWCGAHRLVSLMRRTFVSHTLSDNTVPYRLWLEDIYRNRVFIEAT